MSTDPRVLIVDGEPDSAAALADALRKEGRDVTVARDAGAAFGLLRDRVPDLVVAAATLPDLDGTELLRRVRADPRTGALPVILVGRQADEVERVLALEMGADDFVEHARGLRELALRVRAILRRAGVREHVPSEALRAGPIEIDLARHRATVSGQDARLSALELRLLAHMARSSGRVVTRQSFFEHAWGPSAPTTVRAVDAHVKRLRRKLGVARFWIETVRGVGYRLRDGRRTTARRVP